jgi:hypothetical protein
VAGHTNTVSAPSGSADQVPDAGGEPVHGERLGQQMHTRIKMPVADDSVLGIAGDEQHLQLRPFMPPGRPTSVTSRSIRTSDCMIRRPAAPSVASIAV